MNNVKISDITLKQTGKGFTLSFKEKIEIPKLLDKLGVSVIELEGIEQVKVDSLRIKSVATTVKNSIVAVPVSLSAESVDTTWNALKDAIHPRLQVVAPVSTVQMEYLYHRKPDGMLQAIKDTVAACAAKTSDVEFIADDATRSDESFLYQVIQTAIAAGAKTITVCDATGSILPEELGSFLDKLNDNVPELQNVTLGISCSNDLAMADACAVAALTHGVREIKAAAYQIDKVSLPHVARLLATKGSSLGVTSPVRITEINRIARQIAWMCETNRDKNSPFDNGVQDELMEDVAVSCHDDVNAVHSAAFKIGYDLSEDDAQKVWDVIQDNTKIKEQISYKELDTIIATVAMQAPATYILDTYTITNSNVTSSVAHMKLLKNDQPLEGVALGDGPIDASFLALENIIGRHYELDDFQVRSVTEGRQAMGEAIVKLRNNGKLYSGRGISTDIVGSSIQAYINALNKIVYEEGEV